MGPLSTSVPSPLLEHTSLRGKTPLCSRAQRDGGRLARVVLQSRTICSLSRKCKARDPVDHDAFAQSSAL